MSCVRDTENKHNIICTSGSVVEYRLAKARVAGSNPVSCLITKKFIRKDGLFCYSVWNVFWLEHCKLQSNLLSHTCVTLFEESRLVLNETKDSSLEGSFVLFKYQIEFKLIRSEPSEEWEWRLTRRDSHFFLWLCAAKTLRGGAGSNPVSCLITKKFIRKDGLFSYCETEGVKHFQTATGIQMATLR